MGFKGWIYSLSNPSLAGLEKLEESTQDRRLEKNKYWTVISGQIVHLSR